MFDKIFENAKMVSDAVSTKEYKTLSVKKEGVWHDYKKVEREDVVSKELFDIISENHWNIQSYKKRTDDINLFEEYCPSVEEYIVNNDKYSFKISNLLDADIDEGIFAVYNVENIKTEEKIEYYCDLSCRNTARCKFDRFLTLIDSDSEDDYVKKIYKDYIDISKKLEENGIKVLKDSVMYKAEKIRGFIELENRIFIVPYLGWNYDIRIVVTNDPTWEVNSYNGKNKIGYYIYRPDIQTIIDNINAFKLHIEGKFGYLEDGKYYNNKDVQEYFNKFCDKDEYGHYRKAYNYRDIEIDKISAWDGRGYGNYPYISVYNGLEIASHYHFTINVKGTINKSDIVLTYNKKENDKLCKLIINNYDYNYDSDIYTNCEDKDKMELIDRPSDDIKKEFLVDGETCFGTFSECMEVIDGYITKLLEIFNIDIEERSE